MVLNAPCYYNEALASPEQTATAMASPKQTAIGKDSSNPFMTGSLPKTTLCVNLCLSPQWRFLIHCILHCLSPKKTAWEQFSSNIAAAVICLATNRKFNFSKMIFEHMVSNISSPHKFLMYPRFIQICLDMQRHQLQQHTRIYHVPSLSMKVFNNMKRQTKGYSGQEVALFPSMLDVTAPSTSPSRITSSPSHSPEHSSSPTPSPLPDPTPAHTPTPTQPSPTQPSPTQPSPTQPGIEHHLPTPHDSPLHVVHSHRSDEGSLKLQELMNLVTTLYDRIGVLEADLMKTKKTYSSAYTKLILRVNCFTKLIKERREGKQRDDDITALGFEEMVTARDKAILIEEEPKKKGALRRTLNKNNFTKERLTGMNPSVHLVSFSLKMKPKTIAQARRNMIKYLKNQGNFKISQFKGMSYNDIRPIFEKIWDFNQNIVPMDAGEGSKSKKSLKKKKFILERAQEKVKDEEDLEKEELKEFLDIIPKEERFVARHDVEELYDFIKDRYGLLDSEGYDLMLLGDLHTNV
ncbi:hypothetical protein Tco_0850107 [Tanacetum coccineum]